MLFCRVPSLKLSQRLGILYLPTCVGLRYDSVEFMLRSFSWKLGINHFQTLLDPSSSPLGIVIPDLPKITTYWLKLPLPFGSWSSLLRPSFATQQSTGILTCFPSTTLFSLALGVDSPCSDYRRAGILGISAYGLFTRIFVTHVSIRTSDTSSNLLKSPSSVYRTLLYRLHLKCNPIASVDDLAPLNLPRRPT